MRWCILGTVALVVAAASPARAVTEETFQLRSGADVVALCSVSADDPLRAEAIQMCHGFTVGVYATILAMTAHGKADPLICPPTPHPRRSEAIARFVVWAKDKAAHHGEGPADFVGRYLVTTFPCPKEAAGTGARK